MPTFSTGSGVGDNYATLLISFPDVDWFKRNIMGALDQMTMADNWVENGDVGVSFAVEESEKIFQGYIFMGFNPIPVGLIHPFANPTVPAGYLLCDGGTYATTDYPELFSTIGYSFGGSGSDFNVPNLIDRNIIGASGAFSFGDTGGEIDHTLDVSEIPSHGHSDAGHTHSIPLVVGLPAQAGVGFSANQTVPIITDSTGLGFANITNTGGGGAHNNMPPYMSLSYCIYAGR